MTTFNFNTGASVSDSGASASVSWTENGVNFTFSTSANGGTNFVTYMPTSGSGILDVLDFSGLETFTLGFSGLMDGSQSISLNFASVMGSWDVQFVTTGGGIFWSTSISSLNSFNGPVPASALDFSEIRFAQLNSGLGLLQIDSLTATIVCYLEDTGIDTPEGRVAVQDLREGDRICLADGGETTVKWVGIQPVDTRTAHPAKVNPICITAGAIADNVPERDLFVSPDHAIEIDGRLYDASALVNGASIYKVAQMPQAGFTYYHIETEAHEVILAEGCPAESYLDMPDRTAFVNGSERADAARIAEMPLPRIVAKRMVPTDVADRLAARAGARLSCVA